MPPREGRGDDDADDGLPARNSLEGDVGEVVVAPCDGGDDDDDDENLGPRGGKNVRSRPKSPSSPTIASRSIHAVE
jgi:hypothetical protein